VLTVDHTVIISAVVVVMIALSLLSAAIVGVVHHVSMVQTLESEDIFQEEFRTSIA
tara:strand:+ start:537 stop:704 length:168 start_codon:yes stop_codon:yes gene_type:complete